MVGLTDTHVERFAALHEGGRIALDQNGITPYVDSEGLPIAAEGEPYVDAIRVHLDEWPPIGVYPLFRKEHQRTNEWMVNWLAVDLDEGEPDLIHARNLQLLLSKFSITAYIEQSRSKGYHVWVYLRRPVPAMLGRQAMLAACYLVDVPTREVYPKQTELEGKGFGNCLRLPYPASRDGRGPARQRMVNADGRAIPRQDFIDEAWETRATPFVLHHLHSLHQETHDQKVNDYLDSEGIGAIQGREGDGFRYIAREIWDGNIQEDRSAAMYAFACSLFRQRYSGTAVLEWLGLLDERLGKFVGRADRDQRLTELVARARSETTEG